MNNISKVQPLLDESDVDSRLMRLEAEMQSVLERNRRVETHKSWETSRVRLVSVTIITYVTMIPVFSMLGSTRPFMDALVPTTGFFLSTLSLPVIRRTWEKMVNKSR